MCIKNKVALAKDMLCAWECNSAFLGELGRKTIVVFVIQNISDTIAGRDAQNNYL